MASISSIGDYGSRRLMIRSSSRRGSTDTNLVHMVGFPNHTAVKLAVIDFICSSSELQFDAHSANYHSITLNSGQLIFKYVFSKIFHYNHRCDQQNYIILEVVTRPFSKKYKMSNKD